MSAPQQSTVNAAAIGPTDLLSTIRKGGNLADLFRRLGAAQEVSTARMLAEPQTRQLVERIRQDAIGRLQTQVESSPLAILRECGAGCTACCHTAVDVTPLEALAVAHYLQHECDEPQLAAVRKRLADNAAKVGRMTAEERLVNRTPCSLLDAAGNCSVYASRPVVCAGVFSFSRGACDAALEQADAASRPIPMDRSAKAATMGVSAGLQRALAEAGLDGNLYDLQSAVHCALQTPNAFSRWLSREDIFRDCLCTDAHSPPRKAAPNIRIDSAEVPRPKFNRLRKNQSDSAQRRERLR